MNPRILIVDSYYLEALQAIPFDPASTYERELAKVMAHSFGTADFYSRNLREFGWDAVDVIYNHDQLQDKWMQEHMPDMKRIRPDLRPIIAQIAQYEPNVVFLQDLSIPLNTETFVAAQLSCPWPGDEAVRRCDIVFTSFPHYLDRIESLGVRARYVPLAFEPAVLQRTPAPKERVHDVVFIGGVGNPSHWKRGMETLEHVAREIPTFKWWGYGLDTLPADSALRSRYQGQAFGVDMYRILRESKIVLNRHGEVAEGYANNMRMFEATGCGALLVTEEAPNLSDFFTEDEVSAYSDPDHAIKEIRYFLNNPSVRIETAKKGNAKTLSQHTYRQRMETVSETLKGMLN